jgi:hypothetical protein
MMYVVIEGEEWCWKYELLVVMNGLLRFGA